MPAAEVRKTMEPRAVTLTKARETKNTVRCDELVTDQPVVIGTLYAHKWAVKRLDDPGTPRSPSRQPEAAESRAAQSGRRSLRVASLRRTIHHARGAPSDAVEGPIATSRANALQTRSRAASSRLA
jgi:hypothetical protein